MQQGLSDLGLSPSQEQIQQLLTYCDLLLEQNKVMNLTAITEPAEVFKLHFIDSAALLPRVSLAGRSLIDVGTGAGFPGVVLKILEPSLRLTLLDSLAKRVNWLSSVCETLGLSQVDCIHGRGEEAAHDDALREGFDFATARAVARLPLLCELCLPYVKVGGAFLAMKSEHSQEEISQSLSISGLLGSRAPEICDYTLPLSAVPRRLVIFPKTGVTPDNYPRKWSKMKDSGR